MPTYKNDKKTKNKWYCSFYYTNYQGIRDRKKKEGFSTKKDAEEWERNFLHSVKFSPDIPFSIMFDGYIEDMENRLKESTIINKKGMYKKHLSPYFDKMAIKDITPMVVRKWQNEMMNAINSENGEKYSQTYLKAVNNQLSACFNYAVKFHDLRDNPVKKAGSMGSLYAGEMNIWSLEEFNLFNEMNEDDPEKHLMFNILYWSGMRIGEAMALTWNDIDFENQKININKTYQRINGKDIITSPKTEKSKRKIFVNKSVINEIKSFKEMQYKPKGKDRIITYHKSAFDRALKKGADWNSLKEIRLHDLRHSHASLLLHLGVNIVVISKRLGHEKVETTFNIYSHMYPEQEDNLLKLMEKTEKENK